MVRSKTSEKAASPRTRNARAIAEWPAEERPREKLLSKGPDTLTNAELLAIFLRTGVKGKSAVDLAKDLLSRFGSLRSLYAAPMQELHAVLGLGPAKIAQFLAVIEMSKRYLSEGFQERPYVESSEDIINLLYQEMRDLDQEVFKIILLNGQNRILKICDVTRGSLNAALHRKAKELEKQRTDKRRRLFEAQDEVDSRKEVLITDVEAKLQQQLERQEIFTIRWRIA